MRIYKKCLATTHVDAHFDRLSLNALKGNHDQLKKMFVPLIAEHDLGMPPFARIVSSEIFELEDGEYALIGMIEVFEDTDNPVSLHRDIPSFSHPPDEESDERDKVVFLVDPNVADMQSITKLKEDMKCISKEHLKLGFSINKALDSNVGLVIATTIFTIIGTGFFQKIGTDAYDSIKAAVKRYIDKNNFDSSQVVSVRIPREGLLDLELIVVVEDAGNVTLDLTFKTISDNIDSIKRIALIEEETVRIICKACIKKNHIEPVYAVRKDCVGFRFINNTGDPFDGVWEYYVPHQAKDFGEDSYLSIGGRLL